MSNKMLMKSDYLNFIYLTTIDRQVLQYNYCRSWGSNSDRSGEKRVNVILKAGEETPSYMYIN